MGVVTGGGGGGGTYTPPTGRALFTTNSYVSIANGAATALTWDAINPQTILDLTDPTFPAVITAGIYAVSVGVGTSDPITVGGYYALDLTVGGAAAADTNADSPPSGAANQTPNTFIACTYYIPVGGGISLSCRNHDGAAARHFGLFEAAVQRIT
jgi:hypothetical protein